jgi:hypothetical protein
MIDVKKPRASFYDIKEEDTLKVDWLRLKANLNGSEIRDFPVRAPAGGRIEIAFEKYEKEWKVGDLIEVTSAECQHIALSLSLLANQVLTEFEWEMNSLLGIK